jgi:hypothetical protein
MLDDGTSDEGKGAGETEAPVAARHAATSVNPAREAAADEPPYSTTLAAGSTEDAEQQRLTDELASVLSRRPVRKPPSPTPRAGPEDPTADDDTVTVVLPAVSRKAFVSALSAAPSQPADPDDGATGDDEPSTVKTALLDPAAWIDAARRRRQSDAWRRTRAWMLTAVAGALIVVAVAALMLGGGRELWALFESAARLL